VWNCGSRKRRRTVAGQLGLRLIQNPFSNGEFCKNLTCSSSSIRGNAESPIPVPKTPSAFRQTHREFVYRPFQLQKRCEDFFGTHDEPLSVTVRVSNPKIVTERLEAQRPVLRCQLGCSGA
jgi:hypothetical protein